MAARGSPLQRICCQKRSQLPTASCDTFRVHDRVHMEAALPRLLPANAGHARSLRAEPLSPTPHSSNRPLYRGHSREPGGGSQSCSLSLFLHQTPFLPLLPWGLSCTGLLALLIYSCSLCPSSFTGHFPQGILCMSNCALGCAFQRA